MRKRIPLILGVLFIIGLSCMFAETSVLIDFSLLKANGNGYDPTVSKKIAEIPYNEHPKEFNQHMPTLVDYAAVAGSGITEDEQKYMRVSLACPNWEVELNSSARFIENIKYSRAIEWHTKYDRQLKPDTTSDTYTPPEGFSILGIRIHFPESPYNCWALIKPPYEIPAYEDRNLDELGNEKQDITVEDRGSKFTNGYGVVKNVGIIKSITASVYGTQFKNSLAIVLKNENNQEREYHFPDYLDYQGWRKITWTNPNYIDNVANRELYIVPLYPRSQPYVKLQGFRVYRQGTNPGGDFIVYFKDVSLTYDEAVLQRTEPIQHEEAWGILQERTVAARKREFSRLGQKQILRYYEQLKMDKSKPTGE